METLVFFCLYVHGIRTLLSIDVSLPNGNDYLHYINLSITSIWENNTPDSDDCRFIEWNYGGAITFDSIYSTIDTYFDTNSDLMQYYSTKLMNPYLYNWLYTNKTIPGYQIVHNETISFNSSQESAIGDITGLFPIVYIDQIYYNLTKSDNNKMIINSTLNNKDVWYLIFETANHYILQWPRRLKDGTVSRDVLSNWANQSVVNNSVIWADDNNMGLTLFNRLVKILGYICFEFDTISSTNACQSVIINADRKQGKMIQDNSTSNNVTLLMEKYMDFVIAQTFLFNEHLLYENENVNENQDKYEIKITNRIDDDTYAYYAHGYNDYSRDRSCCPWGRANGWILISKIETIEMLDYLLTLYNSDDDSDNHLPFNQSYINSTRNNVVLLLQQQLIGNAVFQDSNNGLWHQVINETSTFYETTCSSAFIRGMIFAKLNGILPSSNNINWDEKIELGIKGLLSNMTFDNKTGEIFGLCEGTGIQSNVDQYNQRSTDYCKSGNPGGPGFYINALVSIQKYFQGIGI